MPISSKRSLIFVEKPEILDDLILSLPMNLQQVRHQLEPPNRFSPIKTTSPQANRSDASPGHDLNSQQDSLKEQILYQRQKVLSDTQKNITRTLQRNNLHKLKETMKLESSISECMEFLDGIDRSMSTHEETMQHRKRQQFEQWNKNVFGEIQSQVVDVIGKIDSRELNRLKNEDYQKYLDITNRKSAIFRDTIIEGEYDPLEVNRRAPKLNLPILKDPTNVYAQKKAVEAAMLDVDHLLTKKQPVYGKYTLPTELWAAGKIEATPFGVTRARTGATGSAMNAMTHRSKIQFDHFDFPRGKQALDAEMPLGKRPGPGMY
jgi:hypothetical protein